MITKKTNQNNVPGSNQRTILRNLDNPADLKQAKTALQLREAILADIQNIEARDGSAMSARMTLLLHAVDFHKAGGLVLRVEALGTLTTEMLTAKDAWCQTSFAPSLGLAWKTLSQPRKAILRECAKVLHYVVKANIITTVKSKRLSNDDKLWCDTEYVTEALRAKANSAPIFAFAFNQILQAASSVLSEDGEEQASAIEMRCNQLIKALDNKTHDDIPAKAWNDLSVLAGRLTTLLRERDKARSDTPTGKKQAENAATKAASASAA